MPNPIEIFESKKKKIISDLTCLLLKIIYDVLVLYPYYPNFFLQFLDLIHYHGNKKTNEDFNNQNITVFNVRKCCCTN